jgi:hypothetical protein
MRTLLLALALGFVSATLLSPASAQGRIVVAHDEWTLSNGGFGSAPSTAQFVRNVADWFTGGAPGNFLARSSNFGLTESSLAQTMTAAGHAWTVNVSAPDTLLGLQQYDAVFLCGDPTNNANLIAYVQGGGNVYVAGGASGGEAALWNTFLGAFGLQFGGLNGQIGNLPIASPHPLFAGVTALYHNSGTDVSDAAPGDPANRVLISSGASGLYAVYDAVPPPAVYCTAKTNSQGCVPAVSSTGFPSVTSSASFTISASNVLNQKQGLFFYGYGTQITPFQGGFKCMTSPTRRTPVQNSGGSALPANNCSGIYSLDFNAWIDSGADPLLTPGREVDGQFWSRDPASPSTTGLTNAIRFVIGS